jgi:branched-chain amino acid transport system permease protein
MIVMALIVVAGIFVLLRFTRFGLIVRATMQNPDMAAALGVSPPRIYMATFVLGAALTGLAGGVLVPVSGVAPTMGAAYVARAFITVIGGGPAIITGSGLASVLFGFIDQVVTFQATPVFGQVALLVSAVVMIRILPQGITGRFFRRSL